MRTKRSARNVLEVAEVKVNGKRAKTSLRMGVALAIGLLIGVERGWKEREARKGERVARIYGLIALLGGGHAA